MAKGNMFQGMARGKVGDVIFSRLNGQQISRVRNRSPRNPRTNAQLYQRAIMATIMQAYSAGKGIFDHSFEGYAVGAENQRYFMKENAKLLRSLIAADLNAGTAAGEQVGRVVGPGVAAPVGFTGLKISEGSYPNRLFVFSDYDPEGDTAHYNLPAALNNETCAAYAARVGLIAGDIYTFCFLHGEPLLENILFRISSTSAVGSKQYAESFAFVRLIVKDTFVSAETSAATATIGDMFEIESNVVVPATLATSVAIGATFASALLIGADDDNEIVYMGLIRSRLDQDLRSTSTMHACNSIVASSGIQSSYILAAWQQGAVQVGDSALILEGGGF